MTTKSSKMSSCSKKADTKNIAIIGAGPAGLIAARCSLAEGFNVDVFEQGSSVGGTWVFTEETGIDQDGFPVHSAMYKNLRTNVPKELMEVSDFHYPTNMPTSYIRAEEVLDFFEKYADKFSLKCHIKFNTRVDKVKPVGASQWNVNTKNLETKEISESVYDAILICSGHYSHAYIPNIPGRETFKGIQVHSHDFRSPQILSGKKTVVVGYGLSGQDIARVIRQVTDTVFVSHSMKKRPFMPDNLIDRPRIAKINENSVEFTDGTVENVDAIVYCTGYDYRYPFLTKECGIVVEENKWVRPLYKGIINIERPTMAFIGLHAILAVVPMFELQVRFFLSTMNGHFPLPPKEALLKDFEEEVRKKVRFFLSTMNGHFPLPPKEALLKDFEEEVRKKRERGLQVRHMHYVGNAENQAEYFEELASTANIPRIPNVINKIFGNVIKERMTTGIRDSVYKIVDDEHFQQTYVQG
ncbi:dimethylaniline monooxygenase [N-oxide-forming] 3-like [Agrilus planipennis]|uniref:Flavin-containing monooxygenase n=1 Tax=Agrilus planipennis TaxID=224129 RepID=A0A7F5RKS0_AGRPL|nr:dimethylaniline monooxygenase [N-oxide-forming] 3-like [Agrilus planipennis]